MGDSARLVVKDFPPDLHRRLRVLKASQDIDMREIVIEAVEWAVSCREAGRTPQGGWAISAAEAAEVLAASGDGT
jgi:hypothetical protein